MCTLETQNATAVIGRNFSSALSERDFSLERLGQVVLSVRKMHAGGGIRSAKVDIRHIDPSRCATTRHRRARTFLRAHSVSPQELPFCIRRRDRRILSSPFRVRVSQVQDRRRTVFIDQIHEGRDSLAAYHRMRIIVQSPLAVSSFIVPIQGRVTT